jgi:hypothetical protein
MGHKFNIDDEVKVSSATNPARDGKRGTVQEIDGTYRWPYAVKFDDGADAWFAEEELTLVESADKFQPGDLVDWVHKDGSQRANGAWDGAKVLERSDWAHAFAESTEGYHLEKPGSGAQGWIAAEELVPHKEVPLIAEYVDEAQDVDERLYDTLVSAGFALSHPYGLNPFTTRAEEEDIISEPAHYKAGMPEGIEVRDIIKAQGFWKEFCAGNVVKYSLRWQYKNGIEDLKKMLQYGQWLVEELEEED